MVPSKSSTPLSDSLTLEREAKRWSELAVSDLKHFYQPVADSTGMTLSQVFAYFQTELLWRIAADGVKVTVAVSHFYPGEGEGEDWKQGA